MRTVLALVGFMCGAVSAYAAEPPLKWCSDGFESPATLTQVNTGFVLRIGDKSERFEYHGPVGTGMNGRVLPTGEVLNSAEVVNAPDPSTPDVIPVRILRDRVFWPCNER
jgi:hypothetical protein